MTKNGVFSHALASALVTSLVSLCPQSGLAETAAQDAPLFTGKQAEEVIADALVKAGEGEDIKVTINEAREQDVFASVPGTVSANADALEIDRPHNHWKALLLLKADGKNLAPMKLSGHYDQMIAVPVLKRRVQAPEVIGEDDIDWEKQPASHLRKNIVTNAHDLTGKSPKRVISQGRPIRADEIANPPVVNKGSQVTLYFKSRNLEIKTFGEALEPGAVGDVIRVRNITSKTIVQGTVMSGDRVRVASPDTDSAEAM